MPFVMLHRIILRSALLTHTAKLLYLILIDYAGQGETCFPKQETLARDLADPRKPEYSLDKVQDCLNELRSVKLLDWSRPNRNRQNVYSLLPVEESRLAETPKRSAPTPHAAAPTAGGASLDRSDQQSSSLINHIQLAVSQ
jgi:Helix-turn-helix domain